MTTIAGERAPDWSSEQWQVRARSWVDAQLEPGRPTGDRVGGAPAAALVAGVAGAHRRRPVWFKANNPGTVHEAVLIATLAELTPDRVLTPIAVDPAQGWSLLPDGGESLRDVLARDPDLAHWERALPGYAALQLASAPRADELVALGVPDHRPEVLAGLFAELLDDREALLIGAEGGLEPGRARAAAGGAAGVRRAVPPARRPRHPGDRAARRPARRQRLRRRGRLPRTSTGATPPWRTRSARCW